MVFRKIFGDEHRQDSLISLINAVLDLHGHDRVVSVTIANPYQVPKLETLKETIVDVRAKDGNGQEFVVEMQCQGGVNWMKRPLRHLQGPGQPTGRRPGLPAHPSGLLHRGSKI